MNNLNLELEKFKQLRSPKSQSSLGFGTDPQQLIYNNKGMMETINSIGNNN